MRYFTLSTLFAGLLLLPMLAVSAESIPDEVRQALSQVIPSKVPDEIRATAMPDLYEAIYGTEVFYVSADGRFGLQGDLVDLRRGVSLTERSRAALRKTELDKIGEDEMISYGPKDSLYTVTVFTDIDCPYCRKLHSEMAEYNQRGIRVRYLLFPRTGAGSPSYDKAVSVWCAADRNAAMTTAKAGGELEAKTCDNPVSEQYELGVRLGVRGTPAIFREDGTKIRGYVPPERLAQMLQSGG